MGEGAIFEAYRGQCLGGTQNLSCDNALVCRQKITGNVADVPSAAKQVIHSTFFRSWGEKPYGFGPKFTPV
jgi:hypothetical protein